MLRLPPSRSGTSTSLLALGACLLVTLTFSGFAQDKAQRPNALTPPAFSETSPPRGATHDVIDEATLRQLSEAAQKRQATVALKTKPLTSPPPSTESSLLTSSIFLSDGDKYTILPVGCVLALPTSLRSRILTKPQGDILLWPDFFKKNNAWIAAKEVTLGMSRGDSKAAAAVMREIAGDTRLVVAVYKGCPITILEPVSENASVSNR